MKLNGKNRKLNFKRNFINMNVNGMEYTLIFILV